MKYFLLVTAIITIIALAIGIVSFMMNDFNDYLELFSKKEIGDFTDIESYPIYNFIYKGAQYTYERLDNFFYNIEYISERLF